MKFRVFWDGKMWYSDNFKNPCHQFMVSMDGVIWALCPVAYGLYEPRIMDDAIVMFWTGLKNTADVDIYDGDIVTDGVWVREVKWEVLASNAVGFWVSKEVDNIKVVGNVHENPKLLETAWNSRH